jgi:hypothetical protein
VLQRRQLSGVAGQGPQLQQPAGLNPPAGEGTAAIHPGEAEGRSGIGHQHRRLAELPGTPTH